MAVRKRVKAKAKDENVQELQTEGDTFLRLLRKPKVFIPLIILIIAGILFYARSLFIVAIVNGQPIARITLIQELEKRGGKQALSSIITQTLIVQEAHKRNIDVSQEELDEMLKTIEDGFKKQGQNLDQALVLQGLTRKDLESQLRIQKLIEKILAKDIKVTDRELSDYIEKNKSTIPSDMKVDEVKKSAREQLEQQKLGTKAQAFIQTLQSKAKIQYFVNY